MNLFISKSAVEHMNVAVAGIFFLVGIYILLFGKPKRFVDAPLHSNCFHVLGSPMDEFCLDLLPL
jgi:hypothetical protein